MSNIINLVGTNFERLNDVLAPYEEDAALAESRIALKGKSLVAANQEQIGWVSYYDARKIELKALVKYVESRVASTRGRLYRQYTEVYSRELSDRMKDKYVDHDLEYTTINEVLIEVEELYEKFASITDALKIRGFALRNINDLVVHQLTDYIL